MNTRRRRLAALGEACRHLGLEGCPACRGRRGCIAVVREGRGDALPEPCAACGEVPEAVIVEVVVTTREQAREAMARMEAGG